MDTFAYVITVTPTGSLLVNETPAAPTDGGPYSSDDLLSWALDQVRQQWEVAGPRTGSDAVLNVTIDDQRDGGYGRQKTRLRPGQAASIDALRARTGKNLAQWTPPQVAEPAEPAPLVDIPVPTYAPLDTVPTQASAATPPRIGASEPAAEDPPSLPEQSLQDQLSQPEPQDVAKPKKLSRFLAKKEPRPKDRPAKPPRSRRRGANQPTATVAADSVQTEDTPDRTPAKSATTRLLARKPKPSTPADQATEPPSDTPPHPGWTKYTPRVLRPRLPEAEKAKAKERQSSSKTIMTVVVTFVLALIVFVAWNQIGGSKQYVAVCVDQRTSARVNTDEPCVKNQAAYFRWWWVPDGSTVPAVGAGVDPQQGSFIEPDPEAPRTYGYSPQGGVYTSSG